MKGFLRQAALTFATAAIAMAMVLSGLSFVAMRSVTLDPIHHSGAVRIPKVLAQVMVTPIGANPSAMIFPGPVWFVWGTLSLAGSSSTATFTYPTGTCGHTTLAAFVTSTTGTTATAPVGISGSTVGTSFTGATLLVANGTGGAAQTPFVFAICN